MNREAWNFGGRESLEDEDVVDFVKKIVQNHIMSSSGF